MPYLLQPIVGSKEPGGNYPAMVGKVHGLRNTRFRSDDLGKVRDLIQSYAEAASAAAATLHGKLGELGVLSEDSYLTGFSSDAFDMAKESGEGLINKETWVDLKDCAE